LDRRWIAGIYIKSGGWDEFASDQDLESGTNPIKVVVTQKTRR
jgi:hypothetical protein